MFSKKTENSLGCTYRICILTMQMSKVTLKWNGDEVVGRNKPATSILKKKDFSQMCA